MTSMTKEKPICGLSFSLDFDKGHIHFKSYEKAEDGGWWSHSWLNYEF